MQAGGDAPIVTSLHDLLGALCEHDTHRDGALDIDEFGELLQHTEVAPRWPLWWPCGGPPDGLLMCFDDLVVLWTSCGPSDRFLIAS